MPSPAREYGPASGLARAAFVSIIIAVPWGLGPGGLRCLSGSCSRDIDAPIEVPFAPATAVGLEVERRLRNSTLSGTSARVWDGPVPPPEARGRRLHPKPELAL